MSNVEWSDRQSGEYARYSVWGEDLHPHHYHTFEEEEEDEEVEEEDFLSFYEEIFAEEMLADSIVRDVSLTDNAIKLSVSRPPIFTLIEGAPVPFKYGDKATTIQEITDGQLSLTVKENTGLQSIKIHANNRTWTIPLDAFPISPPSMPKKR